MQGGATAPLTLDRSPAGDHAELRDVEVGITDEVCTHGLANYVNAAELKFRRAVVTNGRVRPHLARGSLEAPFRK